MSIYSVMLSNYLILCCSLLLLLLIFPNIRIFSSELALHIRSNFAILGWSMKVKSKSHSVVSNSLWPHRLYSPWDSPGQNARVHSLSLLQRIFPTQGSNPGLPHCRQILYQLSHKESPIARLNIIYLFWLYLFFVIYQHSYFIINNLSPNICIPQGFLLPSWWGVHFSLLQSGFLPVTKMVSSQLLSTERRESLLPFFKLTFWFSLHASSFIIFNSVQFNQHWLSPQYMSGTLLAPGSKEIGKAQSGTPGVYGLVMLLNCGAGEETRESLGLQGDQISQS